jgi:hypothetical protein
MHLRTPALRLGDRPHDGSHTEGVRESRSFVRLRDDHVVAPIMLLVAVLILLTALALLLPAKALLSARIVLSSTTIAAGSTMSAKVIVTNDTGRGLYGDGCGFDVALSNDTITSVIGCAGGASVKIPIGVSSWPVTVSGSYTACGQDPQDASHPPCLRDGHVPPLPPGEYRAVLVLYPHVVPTPPSIGIRVTP